MNFGAWADGLAFDEHKIEKRMFQLGGKPAAKLFIQPKIFTIAMTPSEAVGGGAGRAVARLQRGDAAPRGEADNLDRIFSPHQAPPEKKASRSDTSPGYVDSQRNRRKE